MLQCQPLQMSGLHCALVPEMELGRKGRTVIFVALAAGAVTSGWWMGRTAGDAILISSTTAARVKNYVSPSFLS